MAKRDLLIIFILAVFAFAIYGYYLHFPPDKYFDEVYHVENARSFFKGSGYVDVHPPLGKEIIAMSILHFGDVSWVWRLPSVVFGVGVVTLLYLIPLLLLRKRFVGIVLCLLYLFDGLCFTTARIALMNTNCAFFMLLSIFFLIQYHPLQRWPRHKAFLASGLAFGLFVSTKWFGFYLIPVLGIWLLVDFVKAQDKFRFFIEAVTGFVIIPLAIYILAYFPVAQMSTHNLSGQLKYIFQDQINIFNYHKNLKTTHGYQSQWWQWPFLLRPIWYYFQGIGNNMVQGIIALGNPATFAFIFPGLFYCVYKAFFARKRQDHVRAYCFIALLGFVFFYLPWAIQPRATIFFNYFYFALIFALMAEALLFYDIYKSHSVGKVLVTIILTAIVVLFVYFLALFNGLPISDPAFRQRMWLKSWI
jgi:dolichyl-phosphate-mannose--protein O-mannosyl transferase